MPSHNEYHQRALPVVYEAVHHRTVVSTILRRTATAPPGDLISLFSFWRWNHHGERPRYATFGKATRDIHGSSARTLLAKLDLMS